MPSQAKWILFWWHDIGPIKKFPVPERCCYGYPNWVGSTTNINATIIPEKNLRMQHLQPYLHLSNIAYVSGVAFPNIFSGMIVAFILVVDNFFFHKIYSIIWLSQYFLCYNSALSFDQFLYFISRNLLYISCSNIRNWIVSYFIYYS
jgi:hypothetical protein